MTSEIDINTAIMRNDAGFSLLELLITLTLLALVAGLAIPGLFGNRDREDSAHIQVELMRSLQRMQSKALVTQRTTTLRVHPSRLVHEGQAVLQLPDGLEFHDNSAHGTLRFYPDGTSSTAIIEVTKDHKTLTGISIDGVMGRISRERGQGHD